MMKHKDKDVQGAMKKQRRLEKYVSKVIIVGLVATYGCIMN